MSNVVNLFEGGGRPKNEFNPVSQLVQKKFQKHEIRAIGDIQTSLVQMGFSQDPTMMIKPFPNDHDVNNQIILDVDVADPDYQSIFGEQFNISISKYEDKNGCDYFKMETPLQKSSGTFCDVISFIQNFINTNLKADSVQVHTLVASS